MKTTKVKVKKKKDSQTVKIEEFQRELYCKLSKEEFIAAGKQLGQKQSDILSIKNDKKSEMKRYDEMISRLETECYDLGQMLVSGTSLRKVLCVKEINYSTGVVKIIRSDTKEILEKREIYDHEKQLPLETEDKKKNKSDKKSAPDIIPASQAFEEICGTCFHYDLQWENCSVDPAKTIHKLPNEHCSSWKKIDTEICFRCINHVVDRSSKAEIESCVKLKEPERNKLRNKDGVILQCITFSPTGGSEKKEG